MNSIIRIIPVLFIKNGHIVRSQNFFEHQVIGNVVNQCARYNSWNIDEYSWNIDGYSSNIDEYSWNIHQYSRNIQGIFMNIP